MKKVILVYVVLIVAFVLLAVFGFGRELPFIPSFGNGNSSQTPSASATIGETEIELLIADDDEERINGLSIYDSLPENQGMLFLFEDKGNYGFWMKGMNFAIDIIFLDEDTVVNVEKNAQPATEENLIIYEPQKPINRVLELNAGQADELGIEPGTTIIFEGI